MKVAVPKVTKDKRTRRYAAKADAEGDYELYLEEDFYKAYDPKDYEGIVKKLVAFVTKKGFDLEWQMTFAERYEEYQDDKLTEKEEEKFIWQIANAVNPEDQELVASDFE
jgi:hypothetical protein